MKIDKVFDGIEKLFLDQIDAEKNEGLKEKIFKKIEATKKDIKSAANEEEAKEKRAKLYILKKLLQRL